MQTVLPLPSGHLPTLSELQALLSLLPGSAWPDPVPWAGLPCQPQPDQRPLTEAIRVWQLGVPRALKGFRM